MIKVATVAIGGTILALAALIAVGLASAGPSARAQLVPPARFFGTVQVDGAAAAAGTTVRAVIGAKVCGQAQVQSLAGIGVGYVVDVAPSNQDPGCGDAGVTVSFLWLGSQGEIAACAPTGLWNNTAFSRLDLACRTAVASTPIPTPAAIELVAGGNFVAYAGADKELPAALTNIAGQTRAVFWWNAPGQAWSWFFPGAPVGVNILARLVRGQVYVLIVSAAVAWVPEP